MNNSIFMNLALVGDHFPGRLLIQFAVDGAARDRVNRTGGDGAKPQRGGGSGIGVDSPATRIASPVRQFLLPGVARKGDAGRLVEAAAAELEIGGSGRRRGRRRRGIGNAVKGVLEG